MQYRAAVWLRDDQQGEVRLTGPEQSSWPDDRLIAAAKEEAAAVDMELEGGEIIVCVWSER